MSEVTEIILAVVRYGGQVCFVRRSPAVGSAVGRWGVVMGYLDVGMDPETQAWQELSEELGLGLPAARLVKALPAVPLTSATSGQQFLVHPFLFESDTTEVLLNWEHDAVEWAEPARLEQGDCIDWQRSLVRALLEDGSA